MLKESADNQAGMEAMARAIIAALSMHCARAAQDHFRHLRNSDTFDIGGISNLTLGEALKAQPVALSDDLKAFVRARNFLQIDIVCVPSLGGGWNGSYRSSRRTWWDDDKEIDYEIKLVYYDHQMSLRSMIRVEKDVRYMASEFGRYLNERYSTLVHELTHAFDDWRSGGKYTSNKKSQQAKTFREKTNIGNDVSPNDPRYTVRQWNYLNDPIEINARFYQTVAAIFANPDLGFDRTWKRLVEEFEQQFLGWGILPPTVKIRLLKRLAIEYSHREVEKIMNVEKQVASWKNRLEETHSCSIRAAYSKNSDCVTIGLDKVMDASVRKEIIDAFKLFGDIFRKTLATNDLTPKEAALEGFKKNIGRRRDFTHSYLWVRESRRA